jgi:hypothetical protein
MNIEISTKEYRDLLDILHIADVVMSGHRREENKRTALHRAAPRAHPEALCPRTGRRP